MFNLKQKDNKGSRRGFVILIAVLVSSLLISLGAFIANIAVKELSLSTSGRDSQIAFYAADAAIECALYQDLHVQVFAPTVSTPATARPNSLWCNGASVPVTLMPAPLSTPTRGVSEFTVSFLENVGDDPEYSPYARVRITKNEVATINDQTIIESRGYNIRSSASSKRVERALEVTY